MKLQQSPSLYAAAGLDGMDVVRQILRNCFDHVHHKSRDSSFPSLLMVTEVPNIKESCTLIESFLSLLRRDFTRIRIADVEEDVEFIKDYAIERSKEKGVDDNLNWCDLESNGVNNRALDYYYQYRNMRIVQISHCIDYTKCRIAWLLLKVVRKI